LAVRIRRWFGVPPELFETGIIKKMSASDHLLYTYLCWHSDRHSSRQFRVVAKEVAKSTEMSLRSISTARSHLCKLGLVCCDKLPDGTFTYTLCDVRTRKPYPGDPREKINYTPKAKVSAPSKVRKGKSSGSRDSMLQKQTTTQTRPSSLVTTRSTVSSQWTSRTSIRSVQNRSLIRSRARNPCKICRTGFATGVVRGLANFVTPLQQILQGVSAKFARGV